MINKFIHVKNLEKYHPGYKDRTLIWAKIHFNMVQGDPDCELIDNEIDWGRLVKFILLELQAQKPIPLNDNYLTRKGFNLKKRPILLTLDMLQNFVSTVTQDSKVCAVEKRREENIKKSREDIEERISLFRKELISYSPTYSKEMLDEFFNYWSELAKSKKKMLWETKQTWELSRRLITWHNNQKKWSKNGTNKRSITEEGFKRIAKSISDDPRLK